MLVRAGLILAALTVLAYIGYAVFDAGRESAEKTIMEDNRDARDNADRAADGLRDCPHGMRDFATGECDRP